MNTPNSVSASRSGLPLTSTAGSGAPAVARVTPSSEAPVHAARSQHSARRESALQRYEAAFPQLRALRQQAQREALRQVDNSRPAFHPLEAAKRRMLIEGALLQANPALSLAQVSEILNMGHTVRLDSPIPHADALQRMSDALDHLFAESEDAPLPSLVQLGGLLDQGLNDLSRHLEGQLGLYQQVLQRTVLDDAQRAQVEAGQKALQALAEQWSTDVKDKVLGQALALAESRLQSARHALQQAPQQALVQSQAEQWQKVHDYLQSACDEFTSEGEFATALQHVRHDSQVAAMQASNSGLFSAMRTFMAHSVPPGIASTLLYVLARAYVSPQLAGVEFVARALGSGMLIGAVHETLDNFAKPAAREVLASLGMAELREVDAREVIADPPRAVIADGRYQERDQEQMAAARSEVEQLRKAFDNARQDYNTGTLRGDAITLTSLPGTQMARELLNVVSSHNVASTGAMAMAAFLGNVGMYGLQALGQRHKAFIHDGQALPTHVPKAPPQQALGSRLSASLRSALASADLRDPSIRQKYASKGWSAAAGMLGYNAVEAPIRQADTSTAAGVVSALLLTGLQTFLMQLMFYANKPAGDEAKADGTGRFANALNNIRDPDRESLPHGSRPGTTERRLENAYDRLRGVLQAPPQAATEITEALASTLASGVADAGRQLAQQASQQQQRLSRMVDTRVFAAVTGGLEHLGRQVAEQAQRQRARHHAAAPPGEDIEMGLSAPRRPDAP